MLVAARRTARSGNIADCSSKSSDGIMAACRHLDKNMGKKTALISFLGKSKIAAGGRYQEAIYRLPDGREATSRLISITLAEQLRPDRLVIMGTPGSMWDLLLTEELALEAADDTVCEVIDATRDGRVNDEHLMPFAHLLGERLAMEARLLVIPYGRDAAEQQAIVVNMADAVEGCDEVDIDVTHGLRHLPMVALAAAQLMQQLRGKTIRGLHYGALELSEHGITPIVRLDGLLAIDRWVRALQTFDKDGDYGVFVPLLEGLVEQEAIEQLAKAAFFERINDARNARGPLRRVLTLLEDRAFDQPIERLFIPALKDRVSWALEERLGARQIELARRYLARDDYLRAVLLAWEALITHETLTAGRDPQKYDDREATNKMLKEDRELKDLYQDLRNLRNSIAHGEAPRRKSVMQLVAAENKLREFLTGFLNKLADHIRD